MGEFICRIFAWPLVKAYEITGSYGLAVIFFALLVNLILTPFMAKSKQSMMRSTRLQPKIQELQRRHEGNQQKLNAEMQKLYQEEGINPMSGCLWSLIPFPILIALYSVIRRPITRMMFAADAVVDTLKEFMITHGWYTEVAGRADAYSEIKLANLAHQHWDEVSSSLAGKIDGLMNLDYGFLGLNLGDQPQWNFFMDTNWSDPKVWAPAFGLFLIPFISAALSWLAMKVSQASNPSGDTQAAASMKTMNLMMPLMSIWICFIMPAAMGVYWIANSVFGIIRDYILTKVYKKKLDEEDAVRAAQRAEREKEMEAKKAEYERLKAEGKTPINTNTSKKKLQASEKQRLDERKAALERADRAARRERLGIKEYEKPASQVGNRRYARGRAYVPDRFDHPETAEAATLAAAEESEFAPAIDESVEESVVEAAAVEAVEETVAAEEPVESGPVEEFKPLAAPAPAEAAPPADAAADPGAEFDVDAGDGDE